MKITFNAEEIEQVLVDKVNAMGLKVNRCDIKVSYSHVDSATVYFDAPIEPAPVCPVETEQS